MAEPSIATLPASVASQLCLICDETLYREAERFCQQHCSAGAPERSQLYGLLQYAGRWNDLVKYCNHQRQRGWSGCKEHYTGFYTALGQWLRTLDSKQVREWDLIPAGLDKKDGSRLRQELCDRLAAAFIYHLVADIQYAVASGRGGRRDGGEDNA